jgi:hypothetical protein
MIPRIPCPPFHGVPPKSKGDSLQIHETTYPVTCTESFDISYRGKRKSKMHEAAQRHISARDDSLGEAVPYRHMAVIIAISTALPSWDSWIHTKR